MHPLIKHQDKSRWTLLWGPHTLPWARLGPQGCYPDVGVWIGCSWIIYSSFAPGTRACDWDLQQKHVVWELAVPQRDGSYCQENWKGCHREETQVHSQPWPWPWPVLMNWGIQTAPRDASYPLTKLLKALPPPLKDLSPWSDLEDSFYFLGV